MQNQLQDRDFEIVEILRDRQANAMAIVAIHSTVLGPAVGGIRTRHYSGLTPATTDALRLAEAMTWKCALAGIHAGGGKVVMMENAELDRERAFRMVGTAVNRLNGMFYTGPDAGTRDADLAVLAEETRFVAHPRPGETSKAGGGMDLHDIAAQTALGVYAGIERAVRDHLDRTLSNVCVLIQGLGAVGSVLARKLVEAGAKVKAADVDPKRLAKAVEELGVRPVDPEDVMEEGCDVFSPCAYGGVLNEKAVATLRAHVVAGAANNVLSDASVGAKLWDKGVFVVPDFAINAGGLIHGTTVQQTGKAPSPERIREIGDLIAALRTEALRDNVPPEVIALRRAKAVVEAAKAAKDDRRDATAVGS